MRIITGSRKGLTLATPRGHHIRPATDKVKGAVFNILGPIDNAKVLDLYAGTGSMGLEALSRGATFGVFADSDPEALKLIAQNIAKCQFQSQSQVLRGTLPSSLKRLAKMGPFHLAFVDPPYDKGLLNPTLEALMTHNLVDAQSWIIVEHSSREKPECESFELVDGRKYGQTMISFLQRSAHEKNN